MTGGATRRLFLTAVALVAAAIGNVSVESLSDAGVFGSAYHDADHASVLPTLDVGLFFVVTVLALHLVERRRGDWLLDAARGFTQSSPLRAFIPVYALQLALVFAMENAESLLGHEGFVWGVAWLGAPVLVSLIAHALISIAALYGLDRVMRALMRSVALLIRGALELVLRLSCAESGGNFVRCPVHRPRFGRTTRYAQRLGGRAPPPVPTPA